MISEARAKANKKYHEKFDTLVIRVPKGEKDMFFEHAKSMNESLTQFVKRALYEAVERDSSRD